MNIATQKYSRDLRKYYRLPAVQVSLTLVLSLFVSAMFIIFALRPTILSILTLQKTIIESEKTLVQLEAKVKNLQKASSQLETIKPFLAILNTSIPNSGAMYSTLSSAVEGLATQTETILESSSLGSTLLYSRFLTPFAPSKSQSVVILPFSVRVTGSYPAVSTFLTKLLSMERIVIVDTATITKEAGSKSAIPTVSLNISGSAYYLADEAQLLKSMPIKGKK